MAINNFWDYVDFPDDSQIGTISSQYFNTENLKLNTEAFLKLNNLTKKITAPFFDERGLFYTVNKDLREKIRRYNNDVFYLTVCIYKMVNYYDNLSNSADEDSKIVNETLFRKSARCVCAEMFMYEEKIKNLIRVILGLDKRKTKKYDKLMYELKKYSKSNTYIKAFIKSYRKYGENPDVKFIKKIRNDEIHNDSIIDEYTDIQNIAQGVVSYCDVYFVVDNEKLYKSIQQALNQQVILKNALQAILDNHKIN